MWAEGGLSYREYFAIAELGLKVIKNISEVYSSMNLIFKCSLKLVEGPEGRDT